MTGFWALIDIALLYALQIATLIRALTRPAREPSARIAWVLVILALPGLGLLLYFLLGEVSFGRRAVRRMRAIVAELPVAPPTAEGGVIVPAAVPDMLRGAFDRAGAVNGFHPVGGNRIALAADGDAAIAGMVEDIDRATTSVHLLFYIWLTDGNGTRIIDAAIRAAGRGVRVRVMADGLGSRRLVRGPEWRRMVAAGVEVGVAFDTRWRLARVLLGRIDIRDHRKIVVIDGQVTWVGSQNCADPAFRVKPRFAPWIDIMARIDGPLAWQMQQIFVADWRSHGGQNIGAVLEMPVVAHGDGHVAIGFGSGPEISQNAVPDTVIQCLASALDEVVITTPYYVPSMAVQEVLRSTARRGVAVTLILPERNDSAFVGAASRSFYPGLLKAGVRIFEFAPGLLHAKTLTVDGRLAMIGSANLDRRSFELNFENNALIAGEGPVGALRARQAAFLAQSREVTREMVLEWRFLRRLAGNVAATLSPLL